MAAKKTEGAPLVLPKLDLKTISVRLQGTSPLICNRWSEKAKQEMADKQQKKAKQAKAAKDPEACYQASLYKLPAGGFGFPSVGFKAAAVDACSHVEGITKVQARGAFHIRGDMVRIEGTPTMREDMVRVGMGVADIRYRGEFREWACELIVEFNAAVLSIEQIHHLFEIAGFAIGVGEWRPQRDGSMGMFRLERKASAAA